MPDRVAPDVRRRGELRAAHGVRGQPRGQARDARPAGPVHVAAVHRRLQVGRPVRGRHVRDRGVRVVRRGAAEKRQHG